MRALRSVFVLLTVSTLVFAEDVRTWTDSGGKNKMKAKFISLKEGKVTLEKEDGKQFEIALTKLSAADRRYAEEAAKKTDDDNPFKPKADAMPADDGDRAVERKIDWSTVRLVSPAAELDTWKITFTEVSAPVVRARPVALPATTNFFEKVKGLAIDGAGKNAVVGYTLEERGRQKSQSSRLLLCDLAAGRVANTVNVNGLMAPIALSDGGDLALLRSEEFGHGKQDRLELRQLNPGDKVIARFTPYDDAQHGDRDVAWAAFLDGGRFVTASAGGKLAVWNTAKVMPDYQLSIQKGCRPALSADRKHLAYSTGKELAVLDLAEGKVLVSKPIDQLHSPTLAFSPSGKKLALVSHGKVFVWDFATGNQDVEMGLHSVGVHGASHWIDDEFLLVGGGTLVQPFQQIKVWTYHGADMTATALGSGLWAIAHDLGQRAGGALMPLRLPHAAAREGLQKALSDPNFFVLKPGATVTLDVSGIADGDKRSEVESSLTKKLQEAGFKIGSGNITLVASTEVGKERDVTYHTFGRPGNRTYKVQEHFARLKFVYEDKPAWESSALNIPHFVRLKEGETMEQYLKDHEKPNYNFFKSVDLPKRLTKPTPGGGTLGTSRITTAGVN